MDSAAAAFWTSAAATSMAAKVLVSTSLLHHVASIIITRSGPPDNFWGHPLKHKHPHLRRPGLATSTSLCVELQFASIPPRRKERNHSSQRAARYTCWRKWIQYTIQWIAIIDMDRFGYIWFNHNRTFLSHNSMAAFLISSKKAHSEVQTQESNRQVVDQEQGCNAKIANLESQQQLN